MLFAYLAAHLINHALGLVSLAAASGCRMRRFAAGVPGARPAGFVCSAAWQTVPRRAPTSRPRSRGSRRPTGFGSAAIVLVFDRSPDIAANARTGLAAALEVERALARLIGSLADTGARRSLPLLCLAGGVVAQWRGDGSDSILAGAPVNVLAAMQAGRVAGTPPLRVTEELLRAAGRTGADGILLAVPVGRASVAVRAFASASALDPGDARASMRPAAA